jgi:hypothetical protein
MLKLLLVVVFVALGGWLLLLVWPDLVRYLKISRM